MLAKRLNVFHGTPDVTCVDEEFRQDTRLRPAPRDKRCILHRANTSGQKPRLCHVCGYLDCQPHADCSTASRVTTRGFCPPAALCKSHHVCASFCMACSNHTSLSELAFSV